MNSLVYSVYTDNDGIIEPICIKHNQKVLSVFNEEAGRIDFSVLKPFIGENLLIKYHNIETSSSYSKLTVITDIKFSEEKGNVLYYEEVQL